MDDILNQDLRLEIIEEKYSINSFFVSENPEIIEIFSNKKFYARIELAEFKGVWDYGFEIQFKYGSYNGGGRLPNFSGDLGCDYYPTRSAAKKAALEYLLERVNNTDPGSHCNYNEDGDSVSPAKVVSKIPFIEAIKAKMQSEQLSLF